MGSWLSLVFASTLANIPGVALIPVRNLTGKRFKVVATASAGAVDDRTLFEFHGKGDLVYANYAGGSIRLGFLVGAFRDPKLPNDSSNPVAFRQIAWLL